MRNYKLLAVVICFAGLISAGCSSDSGKVDTEYDTVAAAVTESISAQPLKAGNSTVKELSELPYDAGSAMLTGAPVGGSPRFYKFADGLTYFVYDSYYKTVHECTLALPEGFDGGNIVFISGGAGSGEIFVGVETSRNGEMVYLDYYFYAGNSVTEPIEVYIHDERMIPYIDTIDGKN